MKALRCWEQEERSWRWRSVTPRRSSRSGGRSVMFAKALTRVSMKRLMLPGSLNDPLWASLQDIATRGMVGFDTELLKSINRLSRTSDEIESHLLTTRSDC